MRTMRLFFLPLTLLIATLSSVNAQTPLSWETLADVRFEERFSNQWGLRYDAATFGETIKAMEGQEVIVSGYMIPMDPMGISYVISKNPNATCFFCGGGGPETVVELRIKPEFLQRYQTDDKRSFKGVLKLYEDSIEQFNYVLLDAEPI